MALLNIMTDTVPLIKWRSVTCIIPARMVTHVTLHYRHFSNEVSPHQDCVNTIPFAL